MGKSKRNPANKGLTPNDKHFLTKHHRKCKSNGGSNDDSNISYIPRNKHQAFHTLFQNKEAYEIADILNKEYLDPDYYFIVKKRT